MARTRRTQVQIEADLKRIKDASVSATSIDDITKMTGLSYMQIRATMLRHPKTYDKIKVQLLINSTKVKHERSNQKAKDENIAKNAQSKQKVEDEKIAKEDEKDIEKYAIDASVTGVKELRDVISNILNDHKKIILTSITINELERLQKYTNIKGKDARYILSLAAENSNCFETVFVDENLDTPDDCIVEYCAKNNKNVALITSDKTMALKARMYGVSVNYLKQTPIANHQTDYSSPYYSSNSDRNILFSCGGICTLFPAEKVGKHLIISQFHTAKNSISVFSDNKEYTNGQVKLKIDDDVYIASKKDGYITFLHFKVISLNEKNNCKLIYSKRIYDINKIDIPKNIPNSKSYIEFLKCFKMRHDL